VVETIFVGREPANLKTGLKAARKLINDCACPAVVYFLKRSLKGGAKTIDKARRFRSAQLNGSLKAVSHCGKAREAEQAGPDPKSVNLRGKPIAGARAGAHFA